MAASCMLRSSFLSPNPHLHQQSPAKSNRASFFTPIKATSSSDDANSKSPQLQKHRRPADENIREEARRDISSHNFSASPHSCDYTGYVVVVVVAAARKNVILGVLNGGLLTGSFTTMGLWGCLITVNVGEIGLHWLKNGEAFCLHRI
ncbi:hypothetical protein MTR67_028382 [Solanum verrucosum]|uniref:Uncharacterized protein n=1 Tax=Solanum verrucosum TaxID=315347 RepID=A0AAF0R723_SOLVR|nr:hypothetical protein MTR67_028382 [Solanum verrucosum]